MTPTIKYCIGIGVVLLAALSTGYLLTGRERQVTPAQSSPVEQAPRMASAATSSPAPVQPKALTTPTFGDRPALIAEFGKARNFRLFIEQAKQRPQEGGFYYAYKALRFCSVFRGRPGATAPDLQPHGIAQRRQSLIEQQSEACSALLREEIDEGYTSAFRKRALAAGDPLVRAEQRLLDSRAGDSDLGEARRGAEAVKEVLRLKDAALLHDTGMMLSDYRVADRAYYFDGAWFSGGDEQLLEAAWMLVPCSFGWDCSRDDLDVRTACATQAVCVESRAELVERVVLGGDKRRMSQVVSLSNRIALAVQQERLDAFRLVRPAR